ncbi:MAG: hypothetical protein KF839_12410 [Nitrosomonas sp.]|nr:hypothetical protein [Nitrosomonas sp.]
MYLIDFYYSGANIIDSLAALHRFYPRYSLKRKIAYLMNAINLLIFRRVPRRLKLISDVVSKIPVKAPDGALAILLHKIAQNGRVYVFELDGKGKPLTVTKIALTEAARSGIVREREILKQLEHVELPFDIPRAVNFIDSNGICALSMSAINDNLSIHEKSKGIPDYIFNAIASLRSSDAPISQPISAFGWFSSIKKRITNPAIIEVVQQIASDNFFAVCAAHCDLGSENVFSKLETDFDKSIFAIIDWEFFTEFAPAMTDRVAYWLGQHHRNFKREFGSWNARESAIYFLNEFRNTPGGEAAAVLALLALLHQGNDLAERVCGIVK